REIAFYILMPRTTQDLLITPAQPYNRWSVSLCIDGVTYHPQIVRQVDLVPEYIRIFGTAFNSFKRAYYVSFSLFDKEEKKRIFDDSTEKIELVITGVKHC